MKRFLTLLLATLMLLNCCTALAEEGQSDFITEMGLRLTADLQNEILDRIDNVLDASPQGVVSHDPFVSVMNMVYFAIQKDALAAKISEMKTTTDDALRQQIINDLRPLFVNIIEISVTDLPTPEEYMAYVGWKPEDILEIREFGAVDKYHFYYTTLPVDDVIATYDARNAFGEDDAARKKARQEIEFCQSSMLEYLESIELEAPVDPDGAYIGKVLQFETTDLDGTPVKSEDLFKDNEITMVNLWGTWCPNCVDEMAELAQIHTRIQEKGCGIVGIEYERKPIAEAEDAARAIMAANGTNYPSVLMDEDNEIFSSVLYYPTTFFVDRQGKILTFPIIGAAVSEYEATLDKLLTGKTIDAGHDTGAAVNGDNKYRVHVLDQDGNPVEGALVQFCDDATCAFQPTNADGVAVFPVSEQKVYEVHILSVPEGYKKDETLYKTLDTCSDVNIFLEKAE